MILYHVVWKVVCVLHLPKGGLTQTPLPADSTDTLLAQLTEAEAEHCQQRRYETTLKVARFRYQASVAEVQCSLARNLDQALDQQARLTLLQIMEDRHRRASTIITSQLPVSKWHAYLGEPTFADAILDRLIHQAHRIELKGESMCKRGRTSS